MSVIDDFYKKLDGREVWICDFFGTRFNLQEPEVSLCHDFDAGNKNISPIEVFSVDKYYNQLLTIANENENSEAHCRKCNRCRKQKYAINKLTWVTINTSWKCNSSCIYCTAHFNKNSQPIVDIIDVLDDFYRYNLYSKNCLFDWGGGEPTLNPKFEETSNWIQEKDYFQRINTNAIEYSSIVENLLKKKSTSIRISMDSGTEHCYRCMKGNNEYERVWNNIKGYREVSDNVILKYNVCNYNSDFEEIEYFIKKCRDIQIKKIMIEAEVTSYQPLINAGPFYYTEKEYEAMQYMYKRIVENGMDPLISSYAFSYHNKFGNKKRYSLPKRYINNNDINVISNGIIVDTFPSIDFLIDFLRENGGETSLWGYGVIGKKAYGILNDAGIKIKYIIDNDRRKNISKSNGDDVIFPPEILRKESKSKFVLLAGRYWKEMLKYINDNNLKRVVPIYMRDEHWNNYR